MLIFVSFIFILLPISLRYDWSNFEQMKVKDSGEFKSILLMVKFRISFQSIKFIIGIKFIFILVVVIDEQWNKSWEYF